MEKLYGDEVKYSPSKFTIMHFVPMAVSRMVLAAERSLAKKRNSLAF
jgi:hypothetical protein